MSETPPSLWKRPWNSPARVLAWFALLVGATFPLLCGIALLTGQHTRSPGWVLTALLASVVLSVVVAALFFFLRWLWSWKNLLRFLFVILCLITIVALFYAEENWRGKHAWQTYRAQLEAKGEKFSLAALAPPPVPDDRNLALAPLLRPATDFTQGANGVVWHDTNGLARLESISTQLFPGRFTNDHLVLGSLEKGTFADLPACAAFYRGNTNYPQAPADASPAETILVALGRFAPEFQQLREAAAARPDCRFPTHYDVEPPWSILLPHLARMKALTTFTHVRAVAELQAGRSADAFDDLKLGLRFSDSLKGEPLLISHLVRIATLTINLQTLREGLLRHAWTDPQLAELATHLASEDLLTDYELAMRGERALETGGVEFLGRQGFRTNPFDYLGSDDESPGPPFCGNAFPSGWFYQNMLTMARAFEDFALPVVDARNHRVFPDVGEKGTRAVNQMRTGPYTIIAKMLLPALGKAVSRSAQIQTYVDAGHVASALERFRLAGGKLPDALTTLTPALLAKVPADVIDGKPLRYRLRDEGGYLLYSLGWNQTDDGGQLAWTEHGKEKPSVDVIKGDWVWSMPGSR